MSNNREEISVNMHYKKLIFLLLSFCTLSAHAGEAFSGGIPVYHREISDISFTLEGHRIYIPVRLNQSRRIFHFILDTGAFTSLSPETAEELGLSGGKKLTVDGEFKFAHLPDKQISLQVGEMECRNFNVIVLDYSPYELADPDIDGFLGFDFLRYFYLHLNYRESKITLSKNPFRLPDSSEPLPLRADYPADQPIISCILNNKQTSEALLDTGSPFAVVFPVHMAENTTLNIEPLVASDGVMTGWPNSPIRNNYIGRIDRIKIGELELDDPDILFANTDHIVFGYEFLSRFQIYLHFPSGEVYLIPQGKVNLARNYHSVGLKLGKNSSGKVIVEAIWKNSDAERAGIRPGTEITAINNLNVESLSAVQMNRMINDSGQSAIRLTLKEGYQEKTVILRMLPLLPE